MEWVETTGRTLDDAKEAALDELGVDEADAEFQILEEPRTGLFGRVRGEARVRARVQPKKPRPKEDRRRRRRPARGRDEAAPTEVAEAAPAEATEAPELPDQTQDQEETVEPEEERDQATLAEQTEIAEDFLSGLVEAFGLEGTVSHDDIDEDTVEVRVEGDELGILIGPRAATLGAVQELTRTVLQRRVPVPGGRVLIDVAGYRRLRREALERFTRGIADEAKQSGARKVLEPMSAADRKVVHDTVNGIDGVRTISEGEEPRRRVVIVPDDESS